jgi:hypothetical protein
VRKTLITTHVKFRISCLNALWVPEIHYDLQLKMFVNFSFCGSDLQKLYGPLFFYTVAPRILDVLKSDIPTFFPHNAFLGFV